MKITFLGAGSSVFARNVLGDCMLTPSISKATYCLYDIDGQRLEDSYKMLANINKNSNANQAIIKCYVGVENLEEALRGADFVINAVQVGGYEPSTVIDFEIPKKYGLRQTIADTIGVGGIFRALRTVPVMELFAQTIEKVAPNAIFLNYVNPMSILTGYMLRYTNVKTVGLCHSVQKCAKELLTGVEMEMGEGIQTKIAGINHMAWLLDITQDGKDLYPTIKKRVSELGYPENDKVRFEVMKQFGYYITESSEHNAEYMPYFIKKNMPELIELFNIPLDEYPRRCIKHINEWENVRKTLSENPDITHTKSAEYAAGIIDGYINNIPYKFGGNVINNGLITNLPPEACVEVPCISDASGISPIYVGALPPQCAALNMTNVNVHLLTINALRTHKKEDVYRAVMLDPHTSAELSLDQIVAMCDEMFVAHKDWLPVYR